MSEETKRPEPEEAQPEQEAPQEQPAQEEAKPEPEEKGGKGKKKKERFNEKRKSFQQIVIDPCNHVNHALCDDNNSISSIRKCSNKSSADR